MSLNEWFIEKFGQFVDEIWLPIKNKKVGMEMAVVVKTIIFLQRVGQYLQQYADSDN